MDGEMDGEMGFATGWDWPWIGVLEAWWATADREGASKSMRATKRDFGHDRGMTGP